MTRVGLVGLGYWGPNLARNFDQLPGAELAWLCDASEEPLRNPMIERRVVTPFKIQPSLTIELLMSQA